MKIFCCHDYSEAGTSEKHPCVLRTGLLDGAVHDQDRLASSITYSAYTCYCIDVMMSILIVSHPI